MTTALIGHTGFIGSHLAAAGHFDLLLNRSNMHLLTGKRLSRLVCAGLPAAKWLANRDPDADRANMESLMRNLSSVEAERFILVSTIDVYPRTVAADEAFDCATAPNHAYGRHRLEFEGFVREHFPGAQIIRLPAVFGPGLRKNIVFDLVHDNGLERINGQSRFQWYPLARLARDIATAEDAGLPLVNLFPEPVETSWIIDRFFSHKAIGGRPDPVAVYDLQTQHGVLFGGTGRYIMSRRAVEAHFTEYFAALRQVA